MPQVEITSEHAGWDSVPALVERLCRAITAALAAGGVAVLPGAEVSVLLTGDDEVRGLNAQWRGKDKATNVLSFPAVTPDRLAQSPMIGDIAMAFETCAREADADGKTLIDHAIHLAVHGTLHLVGFDHETPDEADTMEALERRILATLGIADPYADRELAEPAP